jgi:hypothetical protein
MNGGGVAVLRQQFRLGPAGEVTTASLWLPTPREGDGWDSLHKRKNAAVVQRRLTEVKQMEMAAWLGPGVGERDGDLREEEESGELRPVSEENAMAWRGLPNVGERRHSTDHAGQNRAFICAFGVTDSAASESQSEGSGWRQGADWRAPPFNRFSNLK